MVSGNGHIISVYDPEGKETNDEDSLKLCTTGVLPSAQTISGLPEEQTRSLVWRKLSTLKSLFFSCSPTAVPVLLTVVMYSFGKGYVRHWVQWLEGQEGWVACVTFGALYTAVSFPVFWGYIILNMSCGYHFGLVKGFLVTVFGACVGLSIAHVTMGLCNGFLRKHLVRHKAVNSLLQFIRGQNAFRVILASRLSPVPFGIQNAVFAISGVKLVVYVLASTLGLVPTQVINVYLGTTLRSLEEVLMDDRTATTAYVVLFGQVVFSVLLMAFIVRSGKLELEESAVTSL